MYHTCIIIFKKKHSPPYDEVFNLINKNFSTAQIASAPQGRGIKLGIYYSASTARRAKHEAAYRHLSD
jgi:hypothetical protein